MEFFGHFETHLTLAAPTPEHVSGAARWAEGVGLKFTHIELDRGESPSQPMVTFHGKGTLEEAIALAERWAGRLAEAGFAVVRTKIEVPRENAGVPATRGAAAVLPGGTYFETHVKLLLPSGADLGALSAVVEPHRARLSRNARRIREDGRQERFVTQRCSRVGRREAQRLEDTLFRALQGAGVSMERGEGPRPRVLSVEREFVVHDTAVSLDAGWLGAAPVPEGEEVPPGGDPVHDRLPATFLPNTAGSAASQEEVFDPALKQFDRALRAGEPVFADPAAGDRWWDANRRAMEAALRAIARTPWRDSLVLRGSMAMPVWAGEAARRPRDLDFVVVPAETAPFGEPADRMFAGLVAAVAGADAEGISFDAGGARTEGIWTYERAPGRRVVVPWSADGVPPGTVQVDVVFNELLPVPPVRAVVAGAEVPVASAELSLAWKVQWLYTDTYPQGKDLYDAVLLGERHRLSRELLLPLLRAELGEAADGLDERRLREGAGFTGDSMAHEWEHFVRDCPWVEGGPADWVARFEAALAPAFDRG
ncbi:nucleotidyl transferase AbiEii/AbiGii toxin family protein [Nocardiopsis sp. NPDC055824]